ncbi:MAG TPA: prolyl oligopeptidase family serine peptidase [Vicinamibacterales bacterium]|nr:prolyl oligopeptidase family serine peptidase [Vicinamibacterales bacterium]
MLRPAPSLRRRLALASGAAIVAAVALSAAPAPPLTYPVAHKDAIVDDYFGTKVSAPYRWMEDLDSPAVKQWVQAENNVSSAYLSGLPMRDAFRRRITELWNYPKVTTPYYEGGRWYYTRNTGLQRQSVVYTRATLDGPASVALDPNTLSPDGSIALSHFEPAPDGRHFVYGQSQGGSDWSTLYVRALHGAQLSDTVQWVKFSSVSWTKDGKGFFYGRYAEPPAGRMLQAAVHDKKIYYHVLGTPQSADRLIYERPAEPSLFIDGELDETGRYLFIDTNKGTSNKNELFVKDLGNPRQPDLSAAVRPLYPGHTAAYVPLGVVNGTLYLLTDRNAPNRMIVSVPLATPDPSHWKTIVPERQDAIDSASLIAGRLAVNRLVDVTSEIRFYNLDGTSGPAITPPGLGTMSGPYGRFDRSEIFYTFTSPLHPSTVYRFDPASGRSTPFEPPTLTFDPSRYVTERVFYHSKDGTRIPMFITHRKGLALDGANPTMLYGYGGFDIPTLPTFRPDVPAWLERGGVWATANIRGGSEYGEAWHEAGMHETKQNVFDDFAAAAQYLVDRRYASPATLAIMGGSNGGLLVGAVMEQHPDLFAVALPAVGVMDMLRYHKFTGGGAWATEYGSSDDPVAFKYLDKYSPLQNIRPGTCYPATLVTTADHDDRVVPSHSFKFTAALQAAQGCARPVIIRVETEASHGYRPTDKRIAEEADQWAFALANMQTGKSGNGGRR